MTNIQQTLDQLKTMGYSPHPTQKGVLVSDKFLSEIKAAAVEGIAEAVHTIQAKAIPTYPKDHVAGMRVPKGGSSCASCEYLADNKKDCTSTYFQKWNGSPVIPGKIDEYCSDWYVPNRKLEAATEVSLGGDKAGSLWNGIRLTGFTGPEEEGIRAMLSRIPPELLTNVLEIHSAKELNAKHGRFIPATKIIQFNPKDFALRQRFGKGQGWIFHPELTVVHEVFHSIYDILSPEKKDEWLGLGGWMIGTKEGQSPAHVEGRPGWAHETSEWTHKAGVVYPRYYSEKDPNEAFADCGAFYILGKGHQMSPALKAFMDKFIHTNVKRYPQASIQSPERPRPE